MTFELPDQKNVNTLFSDQSACAALLKNDRANQCLRRVYCRTNLAMVEGCLFYFKAASYRFSHGMRAFMNLMSTSGHLLRGPIYNDLISAGEAELLVERVLDVGSNGKVVRRAKRFLDFKTNFKFTFHMVDCVYKTSCSPDYSRLPEWNALQQAVKTRNRIPIQRMTPL